MYETRQHKIPVSRILNSSTRFKYQYKKFEYGNTNASTVQIRNNVIQGVFILKQEGKYKIVDEPINKNLYINTGEYKCINDADCDDSCIGYFLFNREQRNTNQVYEVYKERILDTRMCANLANETEIKNAKAQGQASEESISAVTIYNMLSGNERDNFDKCINKIRTYCLEEGITKVIEGALNNVHKGSVLKDAEDFDNAKLIFLSRLKLMTDFIANVGEQKIGNKPIKDEYNIVPTGSDPHMDGHHALFLVDKKNPKNKKVYKPHSLEFENAFMGKNGFLSFLNQYIDEKNKFVLMDIDTNTHTEEFIERKGGNANESIDEATFNSYMYKLGMLEVAASIWGITDLHAENIIFGANGPVALDAECSGVFGEKYKTGIEQPAPEGPVVTSEEDYFINPSSLYVNGKQCPTKNGWYEEGKKYMAEIIKSHKNAIFEKCINLFQNIDRFRILPMDTSDLASCLESCKHCGNFGVGKKDIREKFVDYFRKSDLFKDLVLLENDECLICIEYALKRGTLPAFEFDLKNQCILIDNVRVGMVKPGINIIAIMLQFLYGKLCEL